MKQAILFLLMMTVHINAIAAALSTSCPVGYTAVGEEHMIITDAVCPAGYTAVGTADSCLVFSPLGLCIMYAPAGVSYTDGIGTYEFVQACAME